MHGSQEFLRNLALILGVAALTTIVFHRLRQPVVFGYMLAGLIVGPHVPVPLIADLEIVRELSELGVILLMFSLGLEFSLRRLVQAGPAPAIIAVLETSLMAMLGYMAGRWFGWTVLESVFAGAIVAISSTTIIVKAFAERQVAGKVRNTVFGVLIFEDVIAIVLLALLTATSAGRGLSANDLLLTLGRLGAFLAGLLIVGMLLVPRLIRFVVRIERPETLLVASMGLCFGCALLAQSMGYSVALGAFIAGSLVAESGQERTVERLVEPVRDVFVAVFFVAVGMLLDPIVAIQHWQAVVALTLLVVVGKIVAVTVSAFLTGQDVRTSVQSGMSLAQIGEFSFIIAAVGLTSGSTGTFLYPVAIAVSAVTTLLTPRLIAAAGPVAAAIDRELPRALQTFVALYGSWIEGMRSRPAPALERARARRALQVVLIDSAVLAAIVIGAAIETGPLTRWVQGRLGLPFLPARLLVLAGAAALSAPFAAGILRSARGLGQILAAQAFPAAESGRLDHAAAPRRALVVTLQLAMALILGAPLVAATAPFVPPPWGGVTLLLLLVLLGASFWRSALNLHGHARAGAEVIVAALARQGNEAGGETRALERAYDLLPGLGQPFPVRVRDGSPAAGRTLAELEIRGRTGATVLAITRGEEVVLVPEGRDVVRPGDVLALAGTHEAVAAARELLEATDGSGANPR